MDRDLIEQIESLTRSRYSTRLEKLGVQPQALGWDSLTSQWTRFRSAFRIVPTAGRRVVDVGCGFGDLLAFLGEEGREPAAYRGIDINPDLIAEAEKLHPDATFEVRNVLMEPPEEGADVVSMFGVLNFNLPNVDNYEYAEAMIRTCWDLAEEVLVFDLLSSRRDEGYPAEDFVYYYSPERIIGLALSLTPHVTLIHDLPSIPQREMQVIVRREPVR